MNHYEELGVTPRATQEDIHQAYRNAVKLMHPDRQIDPAVRDIAERQMVRLNAIAQVLLDPTQRLEYDSSLFRTRLAPSPARSRTRHHVRPRQLVLPMMALIIIGGAILLTAHNGAHTYSYVARANQALSTDPIASPSPEESARAYQKHLDEMTPALGMLRAPLPNPKQPLLAQAHTTARGKSVLVLSLSPAKPAPSGPISVSPPPSAPSETFADPLLPSQFPPGPATFSATAPPPPDQTLPVLISDLAPAYPSLAKSEHIQGVVNFLATVGSNGRVQNAFFVSGPIALRSAAQKAVLQWQYHPAMLGNTPVESTIPVSVAFRLGE